MIIKQHTIQCKQCNKRILTVNRLFCSKVCYRKWLSITPMEEKMSAETFSKIKKYANSKHGFRVERITKECKYCNTEFIDLITEKHKFCTFQCYLSWRKGKTYEEMYGEEVGKRTREFQRNKWKNYSYKKKEMLRKILSEKGMGHIVLSSTRKKIGEKVIKASFNRPTGYEQIIIDLCQEFDLPFKYVGDGKLWIGHGNPDFVHNTKKLLIETYCRYWHEKDYEKTRTNQFKKHGYNVLFLNDDHLQPSYYRGICLTKILFFMENF